MEVLSRPGHRYGMKKFVAAALLSPEMHPDRVGDRVTALRSALRLSKAEFADAIGLDRSTLTKVESGTRGLDIAVAARVAEMYGFGLDYIYRGILTDVPENLRQAVIAEIHAARTARVLGSVTVTVTSN